jgi:hypothetical protein
MYSTPAASTIFLRRVDHGGHAKAFAANVRRPLGYFTAPHAEPSHLLVNLPSTCMVWLPVSTA